MTVTTISGKLLFEIFLYTIRWRHFSGFGICSVTFTDPVHFNINSSEIDMNSKQVNGFKFNSGQRWWYSSIHVTTEMFWNRLCQKFKWWIEGEPVFLSLSRKFNFLVLYIWYLYIMFKCAPLCCVFRISKVSFNLPYECTIFRICW
jgi:hypothetical protein